MISRKVLEQAIRQLATASKDPTRYHMCGVLIRATDTVEDKSKVRLVSTDGHCLTEYIFDAIECPKGEWLLRREDVLGVKAILAAFNYEVINSKVNLMGSLLIGFETGLNTKLSVAESFPDYERVIPNNNEQTARIAFNADLLIAIAKTAMLLKKRDPHISLEFNPEKPLSPITVRLLNHNIEFGTPIGVLMPIKRPL